MKIALISNQAKTIVNFRKELIGALRAQGHEVVCYAPDYDERTRQIIKSWGASPVTGGLHRSISLRHNPIIDLFRISRSLRQFKIDVAISFFLSTSIIGLIASRAAGVTRAYSMIEGLGSSLNPEPNGLVEVITQLPVRIGLRVSMGLAKGVFFVNKRDRDYFIDRKLISFDKAILINSIGVSLTEWPESPPVEKPVTFLFCSRLLKSKGVYEYLLAGRELKKSDPTVVIILLGEIDTAKSDAVSERYIKSFVDDGTVLWHGYQHPLRYLENSSVFVLPTYYNEGVPRSILEALSVGRAVITTAGPGCSETIIDEWNGFFVQKKNPKDLRTKMTMFVRDPSLISKFGKKSRQLAEARFDEKVINKNIIDKLGL